MMRSCLSKSGMSTASTDVRVPFFEVKVSAFDIAIDSDDENHLKGFEALGATHDKIVVMTPTPMTAPTDKLKLQLLRTMSGLYLKSEFGSLMMKAMAT